ncbi:MAG: tetratricopeptide repeat protein, partial [Lachnospiraceae bacterium]
MKHYEEAAEAKRKAVKLAPDNAEYYNSLGITLHAMGRYKEAAEAKKKAVELDPQNANYKESLDRTLQEMEK